MTALPDSRGYFGRFGGRFVPETLTKTLKNRRGIQSFLKKMIKCKKLSTHFFLLMREDQPLCILQKGYLKNLE
jgi:tryptophan synthase beta subunit